MTEKSYHGLRKKDNTATVTVNGKPLPMRLDLDNHSPTGFEWGYAGSGPAQLALAILADALGDDERALRLHQKFKFVAITPLPQDRGWTITEGNVLRMVDAIEQES